MTTTYKPDLMRVSLTSAHWQTLHELAIENRLTPGELVSDWLGATLQKIIDEADYISALESPSNL